MAGNPEKEPQTLSTEEFVAMLLKNEQRVRGFIASLMPLNTAADDIFQNSCLIALKKLGDFRHSANANDEFVRWMCGIARYEVLHFYRQDKRRRTSLAFNSQLIEDLADMQLKNVQIMGERAEALQECIDQLAERDKSLIRMRYGQSRSVQQIAEEINRTANGVYKALVRVRERLLACVKRKLTEGLS